MQSIAMYLHVYDCLLIITECRSALHAIILMGGAATSETLIGEYIWTIGGCSTPQKQPRENTETLHVYLYFQTVVQPVRTEEHAIVHLPMLTVAVPVGTRVTTARNQVLTHMQPGNPFKELMILESYTVICINLQPVVPPVEMEERVVVHLPMLTVSVPVGTQETTARTEVCIAAHTTMQHRSSWSMKHTCTYIRMYSSE